MLHAVRTLVKLDPDAADDAVVDAVVAATQRPDTTEEAFALLEGPLGPRGIDALLELSTTKTAPVASSAARQEHRAEVRANASAALSVMLELKAAKGCTAEHDLLDRVKESGDARVLPT